MGAASALVAAPQPRRARRRSARRLAADPAPGQVRPRCSPKWRGGRRHARSTRSTITSRGGSMPSARSAETLDLTLHDGNYLAPARQRHAPAAATPYKIYAPFWRALREQMPPPGAAARAEQIDVRRAAPKATGSPTGSCSRPSPTGRPDSATEWTPGEAGAQARLDDFADHAAHYDEPPQPALGRRHRRLSPHLHFGEISPRHGLARARPPRGWSANSSRSSAGATLPAPRSCAQPDYRLGQRPPADRRARLAHGAAADAISPPGRRAAPAIRSSMPGCGNCGAGLDAQPRADDRRQLPHQASADRLARAASAGSGTCWSTPITATTASTGNGSRAPASTANCSSGSWRR